MQQIIFFYDVRDLQSGKIAVLFKQFIYFYLFLQDKSFSFIQVCTSEKTAINTCPA